MSNVNIRTDIRMNDVFISWTGKDRELKDRVVDYLRKNNITVLESDYSCAGDFEVWSREAASKCTIFLLLYTKDTVASGYVPKEIEAFKEQDDWQNRLVPVVSSLRLYSEKCPGLKDEKVSVIEFGKKSEDSMSEESKDYELEDLNEKILAKILENVQSLITNRLFKIYREATKPVHLKIKSFLKMVNVQDREFNYETLYINRAVLDENGKFIEDASVFTNADDIFFLHGPAGSGKSCYIDQLRKAANGNTVVISVPCRKLLNDGNLFQAMFEEFRRNCGNRHFYTEEDFKSLLNAKRLLLVLDGMDEIATTSGTRQLLDAVSYYYNAHASETTLFFTSRNKDDANLIAMNGQAPKHLTLCALEESQIATFGENLFMLLEKPDKSEAFYVSIKDLADEIRKNPLLISQLAIIYDKRANIPQTVVGIYDAICEITFSRDNNVSDVPAEYSEMITRRLPRILKAFSAERYRRASIGKMTDSRDDVLKILTVALKGMYDDAKERADFLEEYLRDRAIIVDNDFYHKILLEYFTAVCFYERYEDADEGENALRELFAHYSDSYWSDVIKLFLVKADSLIDANETVTLFNSVLSCGMTEYTLLFDTCRDLLRHKEEAQRTLLCDILKKSADGTYPPYGPMFWYVPEYEIYAPLLMALESLAEEECFTKALALVRDVCWIFGHYNTAKEITEDVDASALLSRANLKGVRLGLCELFYSGSTNETKGDNVYPRCFNLAEAKSWKENGQGVLDRMTKAFKDELGLYSHEMFSELNGEYIGIVSAPYNKERLEAVLPQKSCKKLCGLFFSPTKEKEFKSLAINDNHIEAVYAPENTSVNDFSLHNFVIINKALLYFFDSVRLPDGATEIGNSAFDGCYALTEITIPDSVTKIGEHAFSWCRSLTNISIPDSVTEIGSGAFEGCSALKKITIPNSVKEIGYGAFEGCSSLAEITLPKEVKKIGENAFSWCHSLTNISIPNGVTEIGKYAFWGCTSLTNISIPDGVTEIGWDAFSRCTSLTEITIPDSVERIGSGAFHRCSSLTEITIPAGIKELGWGAFEDCSSLAEITISKGVKEIDDRAFKGCSSLKEITIPDSVTKIGWRAFEDCSSLTEITIPDSVARIGKNAFSGCSSLKEIIVPNSVTEIGWHAFEGCSALTEINNCPLEYGHEYLGVSENCSINKRKYRLDNNDVLIIEDGTTKISGQEYQNFYHIKKIIIPYGVTEIDPAAFYGCSSLTDITIPDSVERIGSGAFHGCSSLTEITIPAGIKELGWGAFNECLSLKAIKNCTAGYSHRYLGVSENCIISNHTTCSDNNDVLVIEEGKTIISAHEYNFRLFKKIIIPKGVKIIGEGAFRWCSSLTEITIPNSVTEIGSGAFEGCSALKKITIPNSVKEIGYGAFWDCSSLAEITIPKGVKKIGKYTFCGCTSLTNISIPKGVKIIGDSAFSGCFSLTSISIPDSVTEISESAFSGCSSLTEINISKGVKVIGGSAFSGCTSLTSISIPDRVTEIGEYAFEDCSSLTEITIPDSVKVIGRGAFWDCSSLKEINIPKGVTEIGLFAFNGCSSLTDISIPDSVEKIGESTFSGCSSLTSISIPDSVKEIGWKAFEGCSSLTNIFISRGVKKIETNAFERCIGLKEITLSYRFEEDLSYIFSDVDLSKVKINWI